MTDWKDIKSAGNKMKNTLAFTLLIVNVIAAVSFGFIANWIIAGILLVIIWRDDHAELNDKSEHE
jgi:Na+-driven multidrug efflux pump